MPSLEDIFCSTLLCWSTGDLTLAPPANRTATLLTAPFPLCVLSLSLLFEGDVASSGSDYWTFNLRQWPVTGNPAGGDVIATRSTNGNAITRWQAWTFGGELWDPTLRNVGKDAWVFLAAVATGLPAPLVAPTVATLRYART